MKNRWSKLTVVLGAAVAMTACTAEVPEHKHPDPVWPQPVEKLAAKVESFTVEPAVIRKGEKATITWKVTDAISIAIKDSDGKGVEGVAADGFSGTVEISPTETTGYILSAIGEGGNDFGILELRVTEDAIVIPEAPLLFAAVPTEIKAGQEAYLVWNGPGTVSITDPLGNPVDTKGQKSGSARLTDLVKTTEFTARSGTQESKATVTVKPAIGTFSSNPAGASAGQTIKLSWTTGGAEEVKISERARGDIYTAAANERAEGTYEDTIPAGLANGTVLVYTLTASNGSGVESKTLQLTVSVTPTITEFKLDKAVLTKGGTSKPKLSWKTTGATRVSIYTAQTGLPTNSLLYKSPSSTIAGTGTVEIPLPTVSTDYELVAEAEQGGQTRQTITLELVDPPVITSFTATPSTVSNGGAPTSLAWVTTGGTSLVVTTQDGSAITSSRSAGVIATGNQTVNPGATTTYTLKITNNAGDTATQDTTVTVDQPLILNINPPIAAPGEDVTISWSFNSIATNVIGAPSKPEVRGSDQFIDISVSSNATELLAPTSTGTASKSITFPDSFKFRYYGVQYESLYVSSHGWVGFGNQSSATAPSSAIPAAATPNNFIAPFACTQGYGKVWWELRDTAPNRKLIVQWAGMKTGSTDGSNYNYEVILHEDGHIDFLYDVMDKGTVTTESNRYVGLENQNGSDGIAATLHGTELTSIPAQNDHFIFFGAAAPDGSAVVKAIDTATYEIRLALTSGGFTRATGTIGVMKPGVLPITEVMYKPVPGPVGASGQWIEFQNKSGVSFDSGELTIETNANPSGLALPSGTTITANGYFILGQSTAAGENGDTPVDVAVPGLQLGLSDTVRLKFRTATMGTMTYDDAVTPVLDGHAYVIPFGRYIDAAGPNNNCFVPVAYGTAGSFGSPKGPAVSGPSSCPFTGTLGPTEFNDIASEENLVVRITSTGLSDYRLRKKLTFPSGFSFPFDGQQLTEAYVSTCGYLTFDSSATDSNSDPNCNNPTTVPSSSTLKGVIAPFWDQTWYADSANPRPAVYSKYVDPDNNSATPNGYLVVQWRHYAQYGGTAADPVDGNFEVRLFENGSVDFHYGLIDPGGITSTYLDQEKGSAATVGIIHMNGDAATLAGHNEAILSSDMSIRWQKN